MQGNERSNVKKTQKNVNIDIDTLIAIAVFTLMFLLVVGCLFNLSKSFFGVKRFEVVGNCPYEASELAAGADIKRGERIYRIDVKEAEEKLLRNCAYLKSASIRRSGFTKITFTVDSYEPIWYVEISGDYYVLDGELNVLEETKNEQRLYDSGLIKLTLPKIKTVIVDQKLTYGGKDEEINETEKIMQTVIASPLIEMISSLDIDNRYDLRFELDKITDSSNKGYYELDDVFEVSIGSFSKLDVKLEYVFRAICEEDLTGAVGGRIDVSDSADRVSVRPAYKNATEEENSAIN